jgi:hypothetical protein
MTHTAGLLRAAQSDALCRPSQPDRVRRFYWPRGHAGSAVGRCARFRIGPWRRFRHGGPAKPDPAPCSAGLVRGACLWEAAVPAG